MWRFRIFDLKKTKKKQDQCHWSLTFLRQKLQIRDNVLTATERLFNANTYLYRYAYIDLLCN